MKHLNRIFAAALTLVMILAALPSSLIYAAGGVTITLTAAQEEGRTEWRVGDIALLTAEVSADVPELEFYAGDTVIGIGTKSEQDGKYHCTALNLQSGETVFTARLGETVSNAVAVSAQKQETEWDTVKKIDFENEIWSELLNSGTTLWGSAAGLYYPSSSADADKLATDELLIQENKKGNTPTISSEAKENLLSQYPNIPQTNAAGNWLRSQDGKGNHRWITVYPTPATAVSEPAPEAMRFELDYLAVGAWNESAVKSNPLVRLFTYNASNGAMQTAFNFNNNGILYTTVNSGGGAKDVNKAFKDDKNNDYKFETNVWHHLAVEFDFAHQQTRLYLDGKVVDTSNMGLADVSYETLGPVMIGGQSDNGDSFVHYFDNIEVKKLDQAPELVSNVAATVSTTPDVSQIAAGSPLTINAAAADSLGKKIERVEFYSNGQLLGTSTAEPHSFSWDSIPMGDQKITVRAVNEKGNMGYASTLVASNTVLLGDLFSNDMIFQRDKPIRVSGTGLSGETVTLSFCGTSVTTTVEGGMWEAELPPQGAVKSADLTVTTGSGGKTVLSNVAVGEIILCSGQSNMARTFNAFGQLRDERDGDYGDIRLFWSGQARSWKTATIDNSYTFSALGYMIGKRFYHQHNGEIPVGLITAAYDGSNITQWMHGSAAAYDPDLLAMGVTSNHYYTYIAPLIDFNIGSVVWYQGEGSTYYNNMNYEKALTALIQSWRGLWRDDKLPFAIVQLPTMNFYQAYGSTRVGIGVRQGQWNVSQNLDQVGTVVSIDTGLATELHPQDKQAIADRATTILRHFENPEDESIQWKSPSYTSMERVGDKVVLHFKDLYGGLKTDDGQPPVGFEIRDAANDTAEIQKLPYTYQSAAAAISADGQSIEINAAGMTQPQVRYAWSDVPGMSQEEIVNKTASAPLVNLYNNAGLPMGQFKTDTLEKYSFKDYDMIDETKNQTQNSFVPFILSITPENGTVYETGQDVTVTVDAADTDGEVRAVEIFIDDVSIGAAEPLPESGGKQWSLTVSGLADGTHKVYAVATDNDGNTSLAQNSGMGSSAVLYPNPNGFVVGAVDQAASVQTWKPVDAAGSEAVTLTGGAAAAAGKPATGYYKDTLELKTNAAGQKAELNLTAGTAFQQAKPYILTVEANLYIEQPSTLNATRVLTLVFENGKTLDLFYFTSNTVRVNGSPGYEVLKTTSFPINKWTKIKYQVDLNRGIYSVWINGELFFDRMPFVCPYKDFEKNKGLFEILNQSVAGIRFIQTSNVDAEIQTYLDDFTLTMQSYNLSKEVIRAYEITSLAVVDGAVNAEIKVPSGEYYVPADLRIAGYDSEGRLAGIKTIETVSGGVNSIPEIAGAVRYRAYLWDGDGRALVRDREVEKAG